MRRIESRRAPEARGRCGGWSVPVDRDRVHVRTAWISDVHLGSRASQADKLHAVLDRLHCETLFLVGDIVDVWAQRRRWYRPHSHDAAVRRLLCHDVRAQRIVFVPGNPDEAFRRYDGMRFGAVHVRREAVHATADGRTVLILHGDEFDAVTRHARLVSALGDGMYTVLLALNRGLNRARRMLGLPYWSLATAVKRRVGTAQRYVDDFEGFVARRARERGANVVVCGHIHHPKVEQRDGVLYANCGDWVEQPGAIVEHFNGRIAHLDLRHLDEEKPRIEMWSGPERRMNPMQRRGSDELPLPVPESGA